MKTKKKYDVIMNVGMADEGEVESLHKLFYIWLRNHERLHIHKFHSSPSYEEEQ